MGEGVGAVGIGDEAHADAADLADEGRFPLLRRAGGAHVCEADFVQTVQGGVQALDSAVHAVVVGGGHQVEAHAPELLGELDGRIEGVHRAGQAGLLARDGCLQVAHQVIAAGQQRADVPEDGGVVVAVFGGAGGGLRDLAHDVAGKGQGAAHGNQPP